MNIASLDRVFLPLKRRADSLKRKLIVVLFGGIPFSIGKFFRRIFYKFVLADIQKDCEISPRVSFHDPKGVHLGAGVKVESFVYFLNFGLKSEIFLKNQVVLGRLVEIKTHAPEGECATVEVGENTYIGPYGCLSGQDIRIGKNCLFGPYVGIFANNHNFDDLTRPICEQGNSYQGIEIGDNCWLGAGVKVLDGVTVGSGCIVGAGSIVTKDLPPYSISVGAPARVVKWRDGQNLAAEGRDRFQRASQLNSIR